MTIALHDFLGLEICPQGDGSARVVLPLTEAARGHAAPLHGGAVATLIDVACAASLTGSYDLATSQPVSTEMHVRFYGQPRVGPVTAEASVTHQGSKLLGVDCVVRDGAGHQIARASGTFMIVEGFGRRG